MPVEELKIPPIVTVGNRDRYSTSTAIAFINENLFVSAAFNSRKIYLVEILPNGEHKIITSVKAKYNPDLMDYKNGMIVTSDYPYSSPDGHASIYDVVGNNIVFRKDIKLPGTKAHGCEIVDANTIIITSNSDSNRGCLFIDVNTGAIKKNFNNFQLYPKDVIVVGNRMLIVSARSLPQIGQTTVIKESILYLFDFNTLEKLDEVTFHGQTDSLTMLNEDVLVTVQGDDSLVHFKMTQDDKLLMIKRIEGKLLFPHGIDAIGDKVAITNYGDNTIRIFSISELL